MTPFLQECLKVLSPECAEQLAALCAYTKETAEKMNITSRKKEGEIVFFHVADSLSLVGDVRGKERVCDVGTGGGFPGLVLATLCPETEFVLMDATAKKVAALEETARKMGLKNVHGLCARAEEVGRAGERERFDAVVSRALASLPMLSELCLPLVKTGGKFVAMKGPRLNEELEEAGAILSRFGVAAPLVREEKLPDVFSSETLLSLATEEEREIVSDFSSRERFTLVFSKTRPTPKQYPRLFSQIKRGGV